MKLHFFSSLLSCSLLDQSVPVKNHQNKIAAYTNIILRRSEILEVKLTESGTSPSTKISGYAPNEYQHGTIPDSIKGKNPVQHVDICEIK